MNFSKLLNQLLSGMANKGVELAGDIFSKLSELEESDARSPLSSRLASFYKRVNDSSASVQSSLKPIFMACAPTLADVMANVSKVAASCSEQDQTALITKTLLQPFAEEPSSVLSKLSQITSELRGLGLAVSEILSLDSLGSLAGVLGARENTALLSDRASQLITAIVHPEAIDEIEGYTAFETSGINMSTLEKAYDKVVSMCHFLQDLLLGPDFAPDQSEIEELFSDDGVRA